MALREIHMVVADNYRVDPNWASDIQEGTFLKLSDTDTSTDGDNYVAMSDDGDLTIGVAGDSHRTSEGKTTEYSDSLIINSKGATRYTENRVSDFYNETLASGFVTVYHSGGTFATDLYNANVGTLTLGSPLYVDPSTGYLSGLANGRRVATLVGNIADYPSGVPGTDVEGSISLGEFITFILNV